ncbi:MAG: orotate phosphoribosyltransferase [Thermoplasmataceae archaeon]|jgi:orotate phosphoribosyltransferase
MLADTLVKSGAIKFGEFKLTSGAMSSYYVDIKEICTNPSTLKEIVENIKPNITAGIIAGVELGAVPLIVATSIIANKPYIIIRKERSHGTGSLIIGNNFEGKEVDLIEDVVTTGGSVVKAVEILRENKAIVKKAICVVDREEGGKKNLLDHGIELIPLVKISQIKR